ncbi:24036_t:CDS:1, partial [Gigaspora rosea]
MTLEFKGEDVLPFCFDNAFNDWQLNFLEGSIIVFSKKKQDIIKWDFLGDVYKEDELNFLPFTK